MIVVKIVSTYSRAEAAATVALPVKLSANCFDTQPRGGGCRKMRIHIHGGRIVSTHSRAEAAALHKLLKTWRPCGFNTQPRGGGCEIRASLL